MSNFDPSKMVWLYTVESSDGTIRAEVFQYASGIPKIKITQIFQTKEVVLKNIPIDKTTQVEECFELIKEEFDKGK
jgi:hypothetical protein